MDIQIDNNFNLVFEFPEDIRDFNITTGVAEQKQRLQLYCTILKGSLPYDKEWGLDYQQLLQLCRICNIDRLRALFYDIIRELRIDVAGLDIKMSANVLNITFYFPYTSLNMDFIV